MTLVAAPIAVSSTSVRRSRLAAIALTLAAIAAAALLRLQPTALRCVYPGCPIHAALHLLCPGCGGTRAMSALLHADLAAAWRFNALSVVLLPFAIGYLVELLRRLWRGLPDPLPRLPGSVTGPLLALAAIFTIVRNL